MKFTPEQTAEINKKLDEVINNLTVSSSDECMIDAMYAAYEFCKLKKPEVFIAEGPNHAKTMIKPQDANGNNLVWFVAWWRYNLVHIEAAVKYGKTLDPSHVALMKMFVENIFACYSFNDYAIVIKPPIKLCWHGDALHCEDGPAMEYADGFKEWAIDDFTVNEKIVMRPHEQTLEEIEAERNSDVREIRIRRFGWDRYLKETNSQCIDQRRNEVEGTFESLWIDKNGDYRLMATCPTKRLFCLPLVRPVSNCDEARRVLFPLDNAGFKLNIIGRT